MRGVSNKHCLLTFFILKATSIQSLKLEVLFRMISSLNYREMNIKLYNHKMDIISVFLSNICFGYVKETSAEGRVFSHQNHSFYRVIKIVHL